MPNLILSLDGEKMLPVQPEQMESTMLYININLKFGIRDVQSGTGNPEIR